MEIGAVVWILIVSVIAGLVKEKFYRDFWG